MRAGSYQVQFSACGSGHNLMSEYFYGAANAAGAQTITLAAGETRRNVNASIQAGATISGHVTDSSSPPVDQANICVSAQPVSGAPGALGGTTSTNANGNYTITGLRAWYYQVQFSPCGGQNLLTEYYNGAADPLSAQNVTLTAGQTRNGVDASLEAGATISGHVTYSATPANDISGICVSVNSPTTRFSFANRRRTRAATTRSQACGRAVPGAFPALVRMPWDRPARNYVASTTTVRDARCARRPSP